MTIRPSLRRGAAAVIADTFVDPDGRGRRVVVLGSESPDPEHFPGCVLVSFDELPAMIVPVPEKDLLPAAEKACVTGDASCSFLEPCAGCVLILRAHLSAALQAAAIHGDAGTRFVKTWNEARATARDGARETARQARAYADEAAKTHRPLVDVLREKAVTMQEAGEALLQEDAPGIEQHAEEVVSDSAEKVDVSTTSPQGSGEVVEKKNVTNRRVRRKTAPSSDVASAEAAPPAEADETSGGPLGVEAVAGPRGG